MSKNWAIRTIKDGKVRIGGVTFAPQPRDMPYDGRLDGMRYAFGRYWEGDSVRPFVCLWGTEAFYHDPDEPWPGPECVDGYFVWQFWHAVPEPVQQ